MFSEHFFYLSKIIAIFQIKIHELLLTQDENQETW